MDKNIIDGRNWEFPEGDDFVDSKLIEKEFTENGVYNGPDEGDGTRGYSQVKVNVPSGPPAVTRAVHFKTHSTGGNDASVDVEYGHMENGEFVKDGDTINIFNTEVRKNFKTCNGICHIDYIGNWNVYSIYATSDGTNNYTDGTKISSWAYNVSKELYLYEVTNQ